MLEIRPCCESCNCQLVANATNAMICSFECTYCKDCVENVLENVCPNCGGGFCQRPIRPANNLRGDNYLVKFPASTKQTFNPVNNKEHKLFSKKIANTLPENR